MKINMKLIALISVSTWAGAAFSQVNATPPATQRVSLSATARVQVAQDLLSMSLTTAREGTDPQLVQSQLKTALDTALALAKRAASAGLMEVRTGRFGLSPRYGRDGKLTGWQGSAELLLEGTDFARISETAGKLQTLSVASVSFGLTQAQRRNAQAQAQSQAIALYRQRASEIARSFDYSHYTLEDVTVNFDDAAPVYRPQMVAERVMLAEAPAPVPVEAGLIPVSVVVSGSVQLK